MFCSVDHMMTKCSYHILPAGIAMVCSVDHMMPKELDGNLLQVLSGFHPHRIHYCISSKKLLPDKRMFETFTTYTNGMCRILKHKETFSMMLV